MRSVTRLLALVLLLPACALFDPLERDAGEAGVKIEIVDCFVDPERGTAKAIAEITSEQEWETILFNADLIGPDGTVISQTTSSLTGVKPGRPYRKEFVFGFIDASTPTDVTCEVTFDFANPGLGG